MISLKSKYDCCGCSACVQACPKQCITMLPDSEGFLYPQIDYNQCINCCRCESACPIINIQEENQPIATFAAKNKNEGIRFKSSSGGIFTLIAENTITNGGIVFGAKFNEKWEVVHDYTETIDGISAFRGSKYVQSQIGGNYKKAKKFLEEGREVLFSGTPCQIAGLHRFLNKKYDNLLTIDIICHGVPSPMIWQKYIHQYQQQNPIANISFRDKTNGWKNYEFLLCNDNDNDNETVFREKRHQNIYMNLFLSDLCLRPSCQQCPGKSGRSHSDITIADFWGVEQLYPEFDDDKGTNLVLVNSGKGDNLFKSLNCNKIQVNFSTAIKYNPSYYKSVSEPKYRTYFFKNFHNKGFAIYDIIQRKQRPSLMRRIASRIKHIIVK